MKSRGIEYFEINIECIIYIRSVTYYIRAYYHPIITFELLKKVLFFMSVMIRERDQPHTSNLMRSI